MSRDGTTFEFAACGKAPSGQVLIVPLAAKPRPALQRLAQLDRLCDGAASELVERGEPGEEAGKIGVTTRGGRFRRVCVVSLGDAGKLDLAKLRKAAAAAAGWLTGERASGATLWIDGLLSCDAPKAVAEWCGAMVVAGFRFASMKREDPKAVGRVRVELLAGEKEHVTARLPEVADATTIAGAVNYARRLAHQPPNVINPATLAQEARKLAQQYKLKCAVLDAARLRKLGMNGLLAVGGGASPGPCLIRIDYNGAPRARTRTVLVGKSITFDTGGYSIKTSGMETMKFDKCGGMTVLGALRAVCDLRLRCNVTALLAAAENAISAQAYRPSDILRMASGKTVEVANTDAEGRLVLADALWYAQKHCKPTAMINLATLTGGVVTALGTCCAGLMSNNDTLAADLGECGRRTHERLWRLPLWDDYRDLIKGTDSDIRNSSGTRSAHAIVGGMFLKEFVEEDVPWAHLDIAGAATTDDSKAATGFGVRLLVEYLRS